MTLILKTDVRTINHLRRNRLLGWLSISGLGLITAGLAYTSFHQLYLLGLQAEARLMLSYIQTLQRVYRSEHGEYVEFQAYYGAPLEGRENCEQPLGAAQLGFLLHGCHSIKAPAPRYAYRSLLIEKPSPSFQLEARAGSDQAGRSLVCFTPESSEFWQSSKNLEIVQVESCW